jgi:hypothetical protein
MEVLSHDPVYLPAGCVLRYLEFETIRVKTDRDL